MRPLLAALAALLLLGTLACVDPKGGGSTGDTALYVHSVESGQVKIQVFGNMETLASGAAEGTPSRTITSDTLDQAVPLAWGGLAINSLGNQLFAVSTTGKVVRIDGLRRQNGSVPTSDVISCELGSSDSDRLSGGKFSQASFDGSTLYVAETTDSESRIWVVEASKILDLAKIPYASTLTVPTGDKGCTGLTVAAGDLYAFFATGNTITSGATTYSGPRLRHARTGFESNANVLVGDSTPFGKYGSLAYDKGSNYLFVARHCTDSSYTGAPIAIYRSGAFSAGSPDQAPAASFGRAADQANLRVIAHPGNRDWLAALTSTGEVGNATLWIWKNPASSSRTDFQKVVPGGGECRGLALDGNN